VPRLSEPIDVPPTVIPVVIKPSPFEKLRARGLLTQSMLGAIVVLVAARFVPGLVDKSATDSGSFGLFYLGIALVLVARIRAADLNVDQLFGPVPTLATLRLTLVAIPLGVLSIAGFWILFLPLSYAAPNLVRTWAIEGMSRMEAHSFSAWLSRSIVAVIIAPVIEEVLFRGLLLQRWALRWGTLTGVILSSALFAIGHVEVLGHFAFGVAMAALYLRTRSLWVPIAAHSLNNFIVSVLTLPGELRPDKPENQQMSVASLQSGWWVGIVVLAIGLALLEAYRRRYWKDVDLRALIRGPVPYPTEVVTTPPVPLSG
jgi:membrane protease YdiL (CAAX protease family)